MDDIWSKSSYSTAQNVNCVECRLEGRSPQVRDSQHPSSGQLEFAPREWAALLAAVRSGEL
jgi:hypothetical protein